MNRCKREISKEIYDRSERGYLKGPDYQKVFSQSELMGYGVYNDKVYEEDGKYYISFELGSSCD